MPSQKALSAKIIRLNLYCKEHAVMVLIGAENIRAKHQVVEIVSINTDGDTFSITYHIHHPFNDKLYEREIRVSKDIRPEDDIWQKETEFFRQIFPRRENLLVYRDILKTLVIDEIYRRTKKPAKPKVDKEAIRARAKVAKAGKEEKAGEDKDRKLKELRELLEKIKQMEAIISDEGKEAGERKKAEIRLKAFRTKAERMAKELGLDLSKPLPEKLSVGQVQEPKDKIKELLTKAQEMEKLAEDDGVAEGERQKAKIRARAFKAKAEKMAQELGIDISTLL